jgi:LDH2 family malate/lactate/ureidoglycolate dehydrogenase
MPLIDAGELDRIGRRVFEAAGSTEGEAEIVAGHLLEANLKGHDSHGVGMIPSYLRNLEGSKVTPNEPDISPAIPGLSSSTRARAVTARSSPATRPSSRSSAPRRTASRSSR